MMASLTLEKIFKNFFYASDLRSPFFTIVRFTAKLPKQKIHRGTIKHRDLIKSSCESLAARGFLRSYKPYNPPPNVNERIIEICNKIFGTTVDKVSPLSREDKFHLLNTCCQELNYSVPNSWLYKLESIKDIIEFYETPVSTTTPYDELMNKEHPPNLHIQLNSVRFNPETDIKFKGVSAFPRSSTIVTGLKYKEKYSSFKAKSPYLDAEVHFHDAEKL